MDIAIPVFGQDGRTSPAGEGHFALEAIMYPPEQTEADTIDLVGVLQEIADERWRQDQQWGGNDHDDGHPADAWYMLLRKHVGRLVTSPDHEIEPAVDYRQRLIKIAALAVAAAQVFDRANGGEG